MSLSASSSPNRIALRRAALRPTTHRPLRSSVGTKATLPRFQGDQPPGDFSLTTYGERDPGRDERSDLREAYEQGRRDAKAGRKRHPVMMTFTVIAAAIGFVVLALAVVNGSFSGAGTVVDQNLATAADNAEPVVRNAASEAGQAVKDATSSDRTDPAVPTR